MRPRHPDPDPIEFTYPETLTLHALAVAEVRYRQRRLAAGKVEPLNEQRKLIRAESILNKVEAATHHPIAERRRRDAAVEALNKPANDDAMFRRVPGSFESGKSR